MYKTLITLLIISHCMLFSDDGNYSIAIGEQDKERLLVLNEIYNPGTEHFLETCQIAPGSKILEIGCGIGLVSQKLSDLTGPKGLVLSTDINEEQLQIARYFLPQDQPSNITLQKLSIYDLSTLDEKFDVVYVRLLLLHLTDTDEAIRQVKKVLNPGGKFIIEDFTSNNSLKSTSYTKGVEVHRYFDELQFEIQKSDHEYFAKLPSILRKEGFSIALSTKSHPQLDTPRKRTMLTHDLCSLKPALIKADKITTEEFNVLYPHVKDLADNTEIEVYSYEMGQICATLD